ncbi:MAG: hypothetical protein M1831_002516 [Alyxoria varia]|nr:MAG: hypothetical protein M1831_002516 [Alyxoria varia]
MFNSPYTHNHIPVPSATNLPAHSLLVKVHAASLCHTDLMIRSGVFPSTPLPTTASHEGAGVIVAVGSAVSTLKVGDGVMCGLTSGSCGSCSDCKQGDLQYCEKKSGIVGIHHDGAFAEYVVVDAGTTVKLPDKVRFQDAAPLACAGATIWRAVKTAGLQRGQTIGIVGSGGGLGHLGVQFAGKVLGLRVVGVEARDEGLELSREFGAGCVVDARKGEEECVRMVKEFTGGEGVDATVNVSDAQNAAGLACAITRMHGVVVQVAQPKDICFPFEQFIFRDIRVRGSLIASPAECEDMLEAVAEFGVVVRKNVFHGLGEVGKMVEEYEAGQMSGKGVVAVVDGG